MGRRLQVVSVCTHNRTRSVLAGALLRHHLAEVGIDTDVVTAGFASDDEPATDNTVRLLADRGIDVRQHRSRRIADEAVEWADLVITAEHDHVVSIAGQWPGAFERTFTLPELVALGESVGPRGDRTFAEWLAAVGAGRPHAIDYLDAPVPEVADPTGQAGTVWRAAFQQIDDLTARLARLLA